MNKLTTCNNCDSVYELSFTRIPMRDQDSLDCVICGKRLYRWSEAKIWEAKLIEKHENHIKP
jgi:hypothetical protein